MVARNLPIYNNVTTYLGGVGEGGGGGGVCP